MKATWLLAPLLVGCVIPAQQQPMIQPVGGPAPAAAPATTPATTPVAPPPASNTQATAPAAPVSTGTVDLTYAVPAGWQEQKSASGNVLSDGTETIAILPTVTLSGNVVDSYRAMWAQAVTPQVQFSFTPAPMRRRLSSGYELAFDGDFASSANRLVIFYLLVSGDKAVPMIGAYDMDTNALEATLDGFFSSARINGTPPDGKPLYDTSEVAGDWSNQAVSIATYVNAGGGYAGDASSATAEQLHLNADGTFSSHFVGYSSGSAFTEDQKGTWTVHDDSLELVHDGKTEDRRIWGVGTAPYGKSGAAILMQDYPASTAPRYGQPRSTGEESWMGHD